MKLGFGFLAPAVIGAVLALSAAAGAKASTLECDVGGWLFRLGSADARKCSDGNDNSQSVVDGLFAGKTGWTLAYKDEFDGTTEGDKTASLTITGEDDADASPTWAIKVADGFAGHLMILLKQGNQFGAFVVTENIVKGTWEALQYKKAAGKNPDGFVASNNLSHASLYYIASTTTPPITSTPVPLPVGTWLALTAVGGFVMLRRREVAVSA